ncbi:peptidylprolyl isomerase [Candidatus Woesearchaeota archaeon]|nr:peptidylprolyl isomerase [Candidatus Woesearchaeota archaeon]
MGKIKTGDFVEVDYTGTIEETGQVFDTTSEEVAKKEKIHNPNADYGHIIICIGQNQILPGIDKELISKDEGKEFVLNLKAEDAFGKKNAQLIRLVPANVFKKQGIQVFVGLEVQIDNLPGIVRSVSGGRVLVDFNHPLSGKDLIYEITAGKKVTDIKKQVESYLQLTFGTKAPKVTVKESKVIIEMDIPPQVNMTVINKLKEIIPTIKTIDFVSKKTTEKK